jgi:hypothetical protein
MATPRIVPSVSYGGSAINGPVYPQELAHHLDGQNFRVAKLGRRTTLAWRLLSLDPIVGQAEKKAVMKMLRSTRAETSSMLAGLNHRQV